ncbi:MAG: hypothetical protein PHE88_01740 [Elusimicrobia bacterium]|nr:hypothetical protein [Elusimicrobiota bacterium]
MSRKFLFLTAICCLMVGLVPSLQAGEGKIGGDLKFYLYDVSSGKSNDVKRNQISQFGFSSLYIFISRELTDKLSLDIEPKISASTSATPKLGTAIGSQLKDPTAGITPSIGFVRAQITAKLPYQVELTAGILRPIFTEDYGAQLFYGEEYHANYASANGYLGSSDEGGIELYKNFELKDFGLGAVSLPAYLYIVNGGATYGDNNNNKGIMVHVAPEIGNFKIMGSFFTYKWDAADKYDVNRWSGGLGFEKGKFMFRSEYMGGIWENKELYDNTVKTDLSKGYGDLKPWGYYAKVAYRIYPWVRILLSYAQYDYNFTSADKTIAGTTSSKQTKVGETYSNISPILNFYASPESIVFLQTNFTNNKRDDDSAKLKYSRVVLGWRTTF